MSLVIVNYSTMWTSKEFIYINILKLNSKYIYGPSSHVLTGYLNVVRDRALKIFLQKDLSITLQPLSLHYSRLTSFVLYKWIKLEKVLDSFFKTIMKTVDLRIKHFKKPFTHNKQHQNRLSRIHLLKEFSKEIAFFSCW